MRGLPHHIILTVGSLGASLPFYASILSFMGYRNERGTQWTIQANDAAVSFDFGQAKGPNAARQPDRFAPGLHHMAWHADSRDDVDRMHRHLLDLGATILDPPTEYPQYNRGRGYYAVFFADPDGLKLEYVYTPQN